MAFKLRFKWQKHPALGRSWVEAPGGANNSYKTFEAEPSFLNTRNRKNANGVGAQGGVESRQDEHREEGTGLGGLPGHGKDYISKILMYLPIKLLLLTSVLLT